jgi:predicted DNA-binding protein with PD1-like motif
VASEPSTKLTRARTMIHPGAFNPVRIQSRRAPSARHIRLLLQPGASLFDGLVKPLARMGVKSASTTILGGYFQTLQYCVAPPDPTKEAVIAYSAPIAAGRAYMVFGNATIGKNANGSPVVHCHAAILTEEGRTKGGHILAQSAIVGPDPIPVLVTSLDGFELRVAFDPETNISLIQPLEEVSDE